MTIVRHAKEIVRQWVMQEASNVRGFWGAFFHGSINWLSDEDSLPPTSDVDVMIVVDSPTPQEKLGKMLYQGMLIEASYLPMEQIRTAEQVLSMSHLAGSLRAASIITDPTGQLTRLQAIVSDDYAKSKWVYQRCKHARDKVLFHLQGLDEAAPFHDQVNHWLFGTGVTTHILLAAGLKNLTVRKRYLAARELLVEYGRSDFYEPLLEMLGCARINRASAEQHLAALANAFDAAKEVIRTPFPFAADISDLARPVAIDGSRELIEHGNQREAVFWMAATYSRCQKVLYHDAPLSRQEQYDPGYRALLADLGIRSFVDLQKRSQEVRELLPRIWELAEAIMSANPEIIYS
jgi:hypothetical protein